LTSNVRSPRDDEEELKAHIAILRGQSKSLKEVLADLLDEEPSEELVEAVKNRILLAQEQEESIDLNKIVQSIQTMQSCWV
jgi:divalent metal cation (Fe/Co/Zn/Cd) transporter|tara:strand:+ start:3148 stop:3390 length:243 start_codon:yes stop_codon:yes gene_type:complete